MYIIRAYVQLGLNVLVYLSTHAWENSISVDFGWFRLISFDFGK